MHDAVERAAYSWRLRVRRVFDVRSWAERRYLDHHQRRVIRFQEGQRMRRKESLDGERCLEGDVKEEHGGPYGKGEGIG